MFALASILSLLALVISVPIFLVFGLGSSNQLTKTGGSSINQANPVPVINLVAALKNSAATIIKMINIARANEAEAKKLLTARNAFILLD